MKINYLVGIIAIILLLALNGCSSGEVIDGAATNEGAGGSEGEAEDIEVEVEQDGDSEVTEEQQEMDVKDLIKELSEEAGLDSDEEEEETAEVVSGDVSIVIDNFQGDPEDVEIEIGATVTFVNEQENFKHVIGINGWENSKYSSKTIDDEWHPLLPGDSWSYTFEEAGNYRWVSKSNYPDTQGKIIVG